MFIKGDDVIFSEVSPRPHDTGMVTMISQDLSEFSLHVRAILGLPIPNIAFHGPSASKAVVVRGNSENVSFENLDKVLSIPDTQIRIFGKPNVQDHRRMAQRSYDIILQVVVSDEKSLNDYQLDYYHCNVVKPHMHSVRSASVAVDYYID